MQNLSIRKPGKISFNILLVLLLIFSAIIAEGQNSVQENQLKFGRLLRLVDGYYVDSVNIDDLTEKAIVKLLSELDPHSTYISKEEVDKMNEPLQGNFEGIGISFNIFKDTLLVTSIISGGPSEKVGLRAGDRILEVDNKVITGIELKNSDVFEMLRGKKGTEVEIKVLRKPEKELLGFKIIRDKIPIYSLDASYMLDKTTGYIRLNKFAATTTDEFLTAMSELKAQNLENLVLDLRGNTGGYLKTAIEISDQFLKDKELVVYTEGTNEPKREYKASSKGSFEKGNLVVLVDENSASASEIVSGAIQDWDRGLIIGRRSFGKGLVQKPFFLNDGSMIRLTTAHYYTPSGRCIQKPYDEGITEYRKEQENRMINGEMFSEDSVVFDESLRYKTLINGRDVYGGGGIMPDIFIPVDTSRHFSYMHRLRRNNIIYNYVLDYEDLNRKDIISKYPEFEAFNKNFDVSQEMIDDIVARGEKEDIEKNEEDLNFTKDYLKKEVKALIARDVYNRQDFYRVYYADDKAILKALDVLHNQNEYDEMLVSN